MKPSLERELVVAFSLLAAGALAVVMLALVLAAGSPSFAPLIFGGLVLADAVVVVVIARYFIRRFVLRPMSALTAAVAELSRGELHRRAPAAETREFTELAERFNVMTDRLLDTQGQLVRAEKLASVGRLAAGVAHEVGNPLSALGTYLDVLRKRGADAEILSAISRETERIDRIVRSLLDYARPRAENLEPIDLAGVLKSVLDLLDRQGALKGITVSIQSDTGVPLVPGRFHDLEQVALNLILNAAAAAPKGSISAGVAAWSYDSNGGRAARRSDAVSPSRASEARATPSRRPSRTDIADGTRGALLFVADSGAGVAEPDREKVFDPFFTTKPPGEGTGLGLAIVQRTVHELGGVVWVDAAREGGAAFKVFLPAAGSAKP